MRARKETVETSGFKNNLRPVLTGAAVGLFICLILTILLSLLLSVKDIPQSAIMPLTVIAFSISTFIGGFVAGKILHSKGLLIGLMSGVIMYLLILIVSFFVPNGGMGLMALVKLICAVITAAIGGIMGVNTRTRRK